MKTTLLFVAISLVLGFAMVPIALSNIVQADAPVTKYCIDGGPFCGDKKTDCKTLLEGVLGDH
ncbi:MAG TPA: hypothetical protein VH500_03295, partial [Nitrososphaeraceae archaeon]